MSTYSNNYALYKWDKADGKLTTIQESSSNADKIDAALSNLNTGVTNAQSTADTAKTTADNAKAQLDTIVLNNGQSDAEVLQARVKADGTTYPLLKDRLNDVDVSLVNNAKKIGTTIWLDDYCVGDGVTDDTAKINQAIIDAYDKKATYLVGTQGKTYAVGDQISFNGDPGKNGLNTGLIVLMNGVTFKLIKHTSTGGVVGIGRGAWTAEHEDTEKTGNILWVGGTVDLNNITGENGFGVTRAHNVKIQNAIVMNTDYDDTIQGGRGFTVHPGSTNVSFDNCYAYKTGDAFHVAAISDVRSDINGADNFTITAITQANQGVFTVPGHNFQVGESVYLYQIGGMTQLNPTYSNPENNYTVVAVSGDNVTLNVDTTSFTPFTSGGNMARSNQLGYRDNGITFENCVAYECRSAFTAETENAPYANNPIYLDVTVDGLTAYNCGRNNGQDGIMNGSGAPGIKIRGIKFYNDGSHPIDSVIRGSFQSGSIEGVIEVDTCNSIINASPLTRVNSPGMNQYPYNYMSDMSFTLKIRAKHVSQFLVVSTDRSGSSYDYTWRNHYKFFLYGYEGVYPFAIKDSYSTNNRNYFEIFDSYNGRLIQGRGDHDFSSFNTGSFPDSNVDYGKKTLKGGVNTKPELNLDASSAGANNISRLSAYLDGVLKGSIDYRHGNNRIYMNISNADAWQFTSTSIMPIADNTEDLGSAGLRMRNIYAGTSTINTSDERLKQQIQPIDDAALRAWAKVNYTQFKYNDAVSLKGEEARWHFGVIAQRVKEAFESEGLDAFLYGLLCYDEWQDENGETQTRYGIRYEEALALECAYLRSKLAI